MFGGRTHVLDDVSSKVAWSEDFFEYDVSSKVASSQDFFKCDVSSTVVWWSEDFSALSSHSLGA
jgi:hypothetical protein